MGIPETSGVSFTTFQLTGASFRWWETCERSRPAGAAPLLWHEFSVLFLEKFVPPTRREELHRQFEQLRQEGLRFVMTQENVLGTMFDKVVDIARRLELVHSQEREEREAKMPRGSGGFSGVSSGGQSHHNRGRPYRTAQMDCPVHHGASVSHGSYSARSGQSSFSTLPAQSLYHTLSSQVSTSSSLGYQEQ
ncbi:uncharacterized protein [Nicotiana tomentosiformis]|uniref:uncharacterized protein n=1 Tax=Nicotiana tomentosiformis TaxID=4098 RepID=UPI00388CAD7E